MLFICSKGHSPNCDRHFHGSVFYYANTSSHLKDGNKHKHKHTNTNNCETHRQTQSQAQTTSHRHKHRHKQQHKRKQSETQTLTQANNNPALMCDTLLRKFPGQGCPVFGLVLKFSISFLHQSKRFHVFNMLIFVFGSSFNVFNMFSNQSQPEPARASQRQPEAARDSQSKPEQTEAAKPNQRQPNPTRGKPNQKQPKIQISDFAPPNPLLIQEAHRKRARRAAWRLRCTCPVTHCAVTDCAPGVDTALEQMTKHTKRATQKMGQKNTQVASDSTLANISREHWTRLE